MQDNHSDENRFISILSDYGFKATFGNEANTGFLRRALPALIGSPTPIKSITFIQNEITSLSKDGRSGIYDVFCVDENNNQFIVEMQLGTYPDFIQRMKFYALYRLNTLVRKGKYRFEKLPRIYCIGILANDIFPHISSYHNIAVLKNQANELIDEQTTFVTVELAKFDKPLTAIVTDLDKLIYTMKMLETAPTPTQYPAFWNEEWLAIAIRELDTRALTPEERLAYEVTLVNNTLAVEGEKRRIEEATTETKLQAIRKALRQGKLTIGEIADMLDVPVDVVTEQQAKSDTST
jgi:predicted transposase/invertase (TIGR01784 family)